MYFTIKLSKSDGETELVSASWVSINRTIGNKYIKWIDPFSENLNKITIDSDTLDIESDIEEVIVENYNGKTTEILRKTR